MITTIIVLIILTGAVIMTMNDENIIGKSKEAVFRHDVTTYKEELVGIKMNEQLKRDTGGIATLDLSPSDKSNLNAKKAILPSFKDEYNDVLVIENGELKGKFELLTSTNEQDKQYCIWLQDISIPMDWDNSQKDDFIMNGNVLTEYNANGGIVIIPEGVTSINNDAFVSCSSLTNIRIPNSMISIGNRTFHGCINLTNITIPDSVEEIGFGAFYDINPNAKFIVGSDKIKNMLLNNPDADFTYINAEQIIIDPRVN